MTHDAREGLLHAWQSAAMSEFHARAKLREELVAMVAELQQRGVMKKTIAKRLQMSPSALSEVGDNRRASRVALPRIYGQVLEMLREQIGGET